jgi:hypothetical protein
VDFIAVDFTADFAVDFIIAEAVTAEDFVKGESLVAGKVFALATVVPPIEGFFTTNGFELN